MDILRVNLYSFVISLIIVEILVDRILRSGVDVFMVFPMTVVAIRKLLLLYSAIFLNT